MARTFVNLLISFRFDKEKNRMAWNGMERKKKKMQAEWITKIYEINEDAASSCDNHCGICRDVCPCPSGCVCSGKQLCTLACGVDASVPQALSKSITNAKVLRDRSLIDFLMFVRTEKWNREQMHRVWPQQIYGYGQNSKCDLLILFKSISPVITSIENDWTP